MDGSIEKLTLFWRQKDVTILHMLPSSGIEGSLIQNWSLVEMGKKPREADLIV